MDKYEAPAYVLTIWQGLLGIILVTAVPMAKTYWTRAMVGDDGEFSSNISRFKKIIYAIIAISLLEVITTYVRIVFM